MIKNISTKKEFELLVKENKKVIVKFSAPWCGPCKFLAPIFESVSEKYKNTKFIEINTDKLSEISKSHKISSIPTLIIFENNEEKKRNVGMIQEEQLLEFIGQDE